ncbi:PEP-utilizing enzyme [Chondromyces crocatus]|uniref:Putative phosphoenol pyruvate synthase n=1 Tax=Chondromyces crocatus TaxID=52 RepID=Q0VZ74_CHOCO|nr:PEP-utilizing enzyme [Chondromyces crocatus]AKT40599.1 uncharacterized protein CMC5_047550 [Chondromyces crocatus]CAJ46688.1 putative phosphoenol pyruvate synthase [Chondromyces crocatus]
METHHDPFPVVWDDPDDAQAFWVVNVVHCPAPMSRLDFDLRMRPMLRGTNRVYEHYGVPIRLAPTLIHGFVYQKLISLEVTADELPAILSRADAAVRHTGTDLEGAWERRWLPEIKSHLAHLSAFDLSGAPLPVLLEHLVDVEQRMERLWQLHTELLTPVLVALNDFDEMYRDLFPEAKPLEVYQLLSGFPNKTVEANLRLWDLGRRAAQTPSLRTLLARDLGGRRTEAPERTTADVLAALSEFPEGRALLQDIEAYVGTYGERNDDLYIDRPTWIEDTTPVLNGLREAVAQADRDLAGELQRQAEQRETRLSEVRSRLASLPRPVVDEFDALLKAAQTATVLSEEHHFWIDCKITYHARRVGLELGRRLAQRGLLERAEDVFQLTLAELVARQHAPLEDAPLKVLVAEREAERARSSGVTPPPFLGVPRPILPMDCAIMRAGFKFNGGPMGPPSAGDLRGMPGSSGTVRGPVRIVRTQRDADSLRPNDILVAPFTLPSWTPYFASVAGVVTNIGGTLCHAAVVAREYGIPAVVGTQTATETLRDGQLVEVDGDAGIVRVLSS